MNNPFSECQSINNIQLNKALQNNYGAITLANKCVAYLHIQLTQGYIATIKGTITIDDLVSYGTNPKLYSLAITECDLGQHGLFGYSIGTTIEHIPSTYLFLEAARSVK